jgi:uncharacterized protein YraI
MSEVARVISSGQRKLPPFKLHSLLVHYKPLKDKVNARALTKVACALFSSKAADTRNMHESAAKTAAPTRSDSMKNLILKIAAAGMLMLSPVVAQAAEGYSTANVNMRAGPSTQYPAVTVIPVGASLEIHGCLADLPWCDVEFYGGRGWVAGQYVQAVYQQRRVYVDPQYYRPLGIPTVVFSVDNYWDRYYRNRDFYRDRGRWSRDPDYNRPDFNRPDRRPDFDNGQDFGRPDFNRDRNRDRDNARDFERRRDLRESRDRGPDVNPENYRPPQRDPGRVSIERPWENRVIRRAPDNTHNQQGNDRRRQRGGCQPGDPTCGNN